MNEIFLKGQGWNGCLRNPKFDKKYVKKVEVYCLNCKKSFPELQALASHLELSFQCKISANINYLSKNGINIKDNPRDKHKIFTHKCSSCFKNFVSSMALRNHMINFNCGKSVLNKEATIPKIPQRLTTIKKPKTVVNSQQSTFLTENPKNLSDISKSKTVIFCQKLPSMPVENSKHNISQRIIGITKPQTSTLSAGKNKNSISKTVICCQKPPSLPVENLNPNISQTLPNPKQSN